MKGIENFSLIKVLSMKELFEGKPITNLNTYIGYSDIGIIEDVTMVKGQPAFKLDNGKIIVLKKNYSSFGSIDDDLFVFNTTKEDIFYVKIK